MFHSFYLQAASTLKQHQSLRACKRCGSPATHLNEVQKATCTRVSCLFTFCTRCQESFHGSTPCRTVTPRANFCKTSPLLPGSARSKKNVRRLWRKLSGILFRFVFVFLFFKAANLWADSVSTSTVQTSDKSGSFYISSTWKWLHCMYFSQNLYTEVNTEWNTQRTTDTISKKYNLIVRRRCQKQNKDFYFILNEMYVNIL